MSASLVISLFALGVSIVAVIFTGWQSVTMHSQFRMSTTPVLEIWPSGYSPKTGRRWSITNLGSCVARKVSLTYRFGDTAKSMDIGTIKPGESFELPTDGSQPSLLDAFEAVAKGKEEFTATIAYIDPRGKRHRRQLPLLPLRP